MKSNCFYISFLLLLASFSLQAQTSLTFGPKASFSVNRFRDIQQQDNINFSSFETISAGAFGRLGFGKLYIQPELYFLVKGANYQQTNQQAFVGKIRVHTLDAPVLLGYQLLGLPGVNLRAMGGPVFNLYSKETENDLKTLDPDRYAIREGVHGFQDF